MTEKKRRISAEDLYQMKLPSDPQIAPDGRHVIFCLQRVDPKTEKKHINLWLVPTEGSEARQFTYGDEKHTRPRWSPDGRQIAFLSDRGNGKRAQIHLIPFQGGEARPLTDMKGAFREHAWSPDGTQLACGYRHEDSDELAREEDEQKRELGVVFRRVTRADYKLDGSGYLPQNKWQIWTIDAATGNGVQLTAEDEFNKLSPRWSPDGKQIAYLANCSDRPDIDRHLIDLYIVPAAGGTPRKIATPSGPKSLPSYSPDGKSIAFLCRPGEKNAWQNMSLWMVQADGSSPAKNLTGRHDVHVANATLTDTGERVDPRPVWSLDGQRLYFNTSRHGNLDICSISKNGHDLQTHVSDGANTSFSFSGDHAKMAFFRGTMSDIGQIWVRDLQSGRSKQLTALNENWLHEVDLGETEEIWFQGSDGNDLQGWILKPPDFDESKSYPSIMEIHGGPWAQYGDSFMHEFYYLAAQGYVVYFTNPRGGQGYGEAHSKAIHRDWGVADYNDLMSWADLVQEKSYIDPERMGVTGGSYGGYMTSWIIGHTDRFKAAVAQRVVSNFISFWGSSDMGYAFEDAWSNDGEPPWNDLEKYWDQSPMKYIANVTTPTMIIHSEQDLRCRQEQGEQVFLALRKLGVDTELILFPDSPHGLSRTGRTDRRIARLESILRWFETYLK